MFAALAAILAVRVHPSLPQVPQLTKCTAAEELRQESLSATFCSTDHAA
jgi:hypothetical protein